MNRDPAAHAVTARDVMVHLVVVVRAAAVTIGVGVPRLADFT